MFFIPQQKGPRLLSGVYVNYERGDRVKDRKATVYLGNFAQGEHYVSLMPWVCDTQNKGPECEGGSGYSRDGDDGRVGTAEMVMAEVVSTKLEIAKIEGIQVVTAEVTGT